MSGRGFVYREGGGQADPMMLLYKLLFNGFPQRPLLSSFWKGLFFYHPSSGPEIVSMRLKKSLLLLQTVCEPAHCPYVTPTGSQRQKQRLSDWKRKVCVCVSGQWDAWNVFSDLYLSFSHSACLLCGAASLPQHLVVTHTSSLDGLQAAWIHLSQQYDRVGDKFISTMKTYFFLKFFPSAVKLNSAKKIYHINYGESLNLTQTRNYQGQ